MTQALPQPIHLLGMRIVGVLGRGAGSTVYEARDNHQQRFAIKHVVRRSRNDDVHIAQAVNEYNIASRFDHENLRRVFQMKRRSRLATPAEFLDRRRFLTCREVIVSMELIDGETLEQHPLDDMSLICKVLLGVAAGLEVMHEQEWVHGDIKPLNVMFTRAGGVKVIDLGLATPNRSEPARIRGTPGFIAPEQVLRQPVTYQTDVFSFGAMMYNLLTKRLVPTMLKARNAEGLKGIPELDSEKMPTPRDLVPAIPPALSGLVMDCIKPKPHQRPPSIRVVRERLWIASRQSLGMKVSMQGV